MSLGATSYAVRRWHKQFPDCCRNSTTGSRASAWDDSNFPQSGVYVYEVTVRFPDGQSRSSTVEFTRPEPVNPVGFIAKQTGEGAVTLSWQAVPGVESYKLWGGGLPNTGVSVTGTSQQVTGVSAGAQEWMIGSFYEPGPVSTGIAAFTRTSLNVASTVASAPAPSAAPAPPPAASAPTTPAPATGAPSASAPPVVSGRYRVVATGFRVIHESKDDSFSRDGRGDEVYAAFTMFHYDRRSGTMLDHDLGRTKTIGDVNNSPDRIQGGSSSGAGGFRAGDWFPMVPDPSATYGVAPSNTRFPYLIWQGMLTDGQDAVVILPALWEFNKEPNAYNQWFQHELADAQSIWSTTAVQTALTGGELALITPPGVTVPTVGDMPLENYADSLFKVAFSVPDLVSLITAGRSDRPLGLGVINGAYTLPRRAIVVTREVIEASLQKRAETPVGAISPLAGNAGVTAVFSQKLPSGTIAIPLFDAPGDALQGQYVMYVQVERIP
jgi:hypothetical protein